MALFKKKTSPDEKKYLKIAEQSGLAIDEIEKDLARVKTLYGATSGQYLKFALWNATDTEGARQVKKDNETKERNRRLYQSMMDSSDKTKDTIKAEIKTLDSKYDALSIGLRWYHDFGICHMDLQNDCEKIDNTVRTYLKVQELSNEIKAKLESIDCGMCAYDSLEPLRNSYFEMMGSILSPERIQELCAMANPDCCTDRKELALDMLFTHDMLGFSYSEYEKFGLYGKTVTEKRRYIPTKEKTNIIQALSPLKIRNRLKDRYVAYNSLKDFYGRKMVSISSGSFESFEALCQNNDSLVKNIDSSPFSDSSSLLDVSKKDLLPDIFQTLGKELGSITLEEPVSAHPELPSSDFLLRIIMMGGASKAEIFDAMARINGEMVPIDSAAGTAGSFEIPDWQKCLETARDALLSIQGLSYGGFDLTYTKDRRWIVMHASSKTHLIDSQIARGYGMRYPFLDKVAEISSSKTAENSPSPARDLMYALMTEASQKTRRELIDELNSIRKLYPSQTISLQTYLDLGLFCFDPQKDGNEISERLSRFESLHSSDAKRYDQISRCKAGELSYDEVTPSYEAYVDQVAALLSPESIQFHYESVKNKFDPMLNSDEQRKLAADMVATQVLLSFTPEEYARFHFWDMRLDEKLAYVSRSEALELAENILPDRASRILSGRYTVYSRNPECFGREMIKISSQDDYDSFISFCSRHASAFLKSSTSQSGRHIEKIHLQNSELYPLIFRKLLRRAPVVLEEPISQGEPLAKLNRTSVNTVSAIMLAKDDNATVVDTYMRIGLPGSDRDTHGILVHVDVQNGRIDSHGINVDGTISSTQLIGTRLPDWEQFLDTATRLTKGIHGLSYVHWDLAYTNNEKWVIVDGNKTPSYDRYQASLGKGVRLRYICNMTRIQLPPLTQKAKNRAHMLASMTAATGKGQKQILSEYARIKELHPVKSAGLQWYYNYGFCHLDPENDIHLIKEKIDRFAQKTSLVSAIQEKITLIDQGTLTYGDIAPLYDQYIEIMSSILSPELIKDYCEDLQYVLPDLDADSEKSAILAADIRGSIEILGFFKSEYISFHLFERNFAEKRDFIASRDAFAILAAITPQSQIDLLRNKYEAYLHLSKYYGRKVLKIASSDDYPIFEEFCHTHTSFVKKAPSAAFGKGIEKITIRNTELLPYVFEKLLAGSEEYIILEELITPHESIRKLNPSSVNTVRVIVYIDDAGIPNVLDTFMKVGRDGSFVDNGGSGGIFVHINLHSGIFDSNGIDEHGVIYPHHPDHGYEFNGYQIPSWEECIKLSKEAIFNIPDLRFVGWDLTYTNEENWVIVEGNGMSQFIAQQSTIQKGMRKRFHKDVGFPEKFPELKRNTLDK